MLPELFRIGPFPVHSFGLMMVLAFMGAWYLLVQNLERKDLPRELAERMIFWAAVGGIVGARVFYVLSFPSQFLADPISAVFSGAGFVFYGGLFGGAFAVWLLLKMEKLPFLPMSDLVAPSLALGYAIGRVGCQLSGDGDYGSESSLPWAMSYALGVVPTPPGVTVHPAPVYETFAALAITAILLSLLRRGKFVGGGALFGLYLALSSVSRFLVETIRIEPVVWGNLTQAQVESGGLFVMGVLLFLLRKGRQGGNWDRSSSTSGSAAKGKGVAAAVIVIGVVVAANVELVSADERVRIGFIATLTGPRASLGEDAQKGAQLALENLKNQSTEFSKIQLVTEDSQGDPRAGVSAYKKLMSQGVNFVLTQNSNVSTPISQFVNRDNVVQLAYSTTADRYSIPDDLTFRVNGPTVDEAKAIVSFVDERWRAKQGGIALIAMEDEYPKSVAGNVELEAKSRNIPLDVTDSYLPKETDFRALIAKLKQKRIEYVILPSYQTEAGYFVKQSHELGFHPSAIVVSPPVNNREFFEIAQKRADGTFVAYQKQNRELPAFQQYKEKFKGEPNWFSASAYDAVVVAAKALKACEFRSDQACLKKSLFALPEFEGMGGIKKFDSVYGDMKDEYTVLVAKGGRFIPL